MIVRARVVLPLSRPPIQDGAVLIYGNRVARVGRWKDLSGDDRDEVFDLGDSILLPGLVNAHCHLDYTDMAGQFPPQKTFTDWIKLLIVAKAQWNYSEYAESWLNGARMLTRTGTTTVGDFEAVPELLPEVWQATPLRVVSFLELTGVKSRRQPSAILRDALETIESLPAHRSRARIAPHAPYSTAPELLRVSARAARERNWPMSVHVAESALEFAMFRHAAGEMHDWLLKNHRDMSDCGLGSPVQHLQRCGAIGEHLLAVHVNYLEGRDAALLGRQKASVVHCPRSHRYFQHGPFPFRELTRAGANICLGTDSLASVEKKKREEIELNLFTEMQTFAAAQPKVAPKKILQMATVNGARALGMTGQIGELSEGAFADAVAIPYRGKLKAVYETVLQHQGDVSASIIDGQWAVTPQ
ncbi:MAG: amidohydrolase family protein [Verrucomicrobiota bacterium]